MISSLAIFSSLEFFSHKQTVERVQAPIAKFENSCRLSLLRRGSSRPCR